MEVWRPVDAGVLRRDVLASEATPPSGSDPIEFVVRAGPAWLLFLDVVKVIDVGPSSSPLDLSPGIEVVLSQVESIQLNLASLGVTEVGQFVFIIVHGIQ